MTLRGKGVIAMMAAPLLLASTGGHGIDVAAREAMVATGARGLAIAVIDRGRVSFVQVYGNRNAAGAPLTKNTVMYGASLTKAVVDYLTAQLASEKRLDLDQPIAALLPQPLPAYGNLGAYGNCGDLKHDDRWRTITPRMGLTHSTGFANFAFLEAECHIDGSILVCRTTKHPHVAVERY